MLAHPLIGFIFVRSGERDRGERLSFFRCLLQKRPLNCSDTDFVNGFLCVRRHDVFSLSVLLKFGFSPGTRSQIQGQGENDATKEPQANDGQCECSALLAQAGQEARPITKSHSGKSEKKDQCGSQTSRKKRF